MYIIIDSCRAITSITYACLHLHLRCALNSITIIIDIYVSVSEYTRVCACVCVRVCACVCVRAVIPTFRVANTTPEVNTFRICVIVLRYVSGSRVNVPLMCPSIAIFTRPLSVHNAPE